MQVSELLEYLKEQENYYDGRAFDWQGTTAEELFIMRRDLVTAVINHINNTVEMIESVEQ